MDRVGQKSKPLLIYQQIVLKPADKATFSLKLNVEQATEVNANNHEYMLLRTMEYLILHCVSKNFPPLTPCNFVRS